MRDKNGNLNSSPGTEHLPLGLGTDLQDASQLTVEKTNKLLALVILLGEHEDHAAHGCQELH